MLARCSALESLVQSLGVFAFYSQANSAYIISIMQIL